MPCFQFIFQEGETENSEIFVLALQKKLISPVLGQFGLQLDLSSKLICWYVDRAVTLPCLYAEMGLSKATHQTDL